MSRISVPREIWALIAGGFVVALGYGVVAPVIPQFAESFGVSFTAASAIVSAFALMRLIGAPFGGWFASRFTERSCYLLGLIIIAVTTGACALANSYAAFILLRSAGGIGSAMFSVASNALLIKLSPANARGRIVSYNAAGFLFGNLFGPVLGALVAGFGLRAPFLIYAVSLLVAFAVVALTFSKNSPTLLTDTQQLRINSKPVRLSEAFRHRAFASVLTSFFVNGWAVWGVRISVVPLFIAATLGPDPRLSGWALAAFAAGNAALIFPSGIFNDKYGRKPLIISGAIISAVCFVALPYIHTLPVLLIVMALAGAGAALNNPGQQAALADIVGNRNGSRIVAAAQMLVDFGSVLGPLLIGLLVDQAGFSLAFAITGFLFLVTAFMWFCTPETFQPETKELLPPQKSGPADPAALVEPNPITGSMPVVGNNKPDGL